jgi:hypothetical protein
MGEAQARLLLNQWVAAEWDASANHLARCYSLMAAHRKPQPAELKAFNRLLTAIHHVLNAT